MHIEAETVVPPSSTKGVVVGAALRTLQQGCPNWNAEGLQYENWMTEVEVLSWNSAKEELASLQQ
jgi:hypothetical protein